MIMMTEWQRRIKRHVFLVAFRNTKWGVSMEKSEKDKVASEWVLATFHTMHTKNFAYDACVMSHSCHTHECGTSHMRDI